MALVFLLSFCCLLFLDKKLTLSLGPYVDMEVERLTRNVVGKAIRNKMIEKKYGSFLLSDVDEKGVHTFSYDVSKINLLKNELADYVQNLLTHLELADIDDVYLFNSLKISKFRKIKNGILAENSVSSLRGSVLFGNVGPTVPIRLYFVGQVLADIDVEIKEYGINNVMVEIYLVIAVKEQVMMPITSKVKDIQIRELIEVDIVHGEIPHYYGGFSK